MYVAAGSLVGFEALALLLSFTTAWPIAIPLMVAGLGALYGTRNLVRAFASGIRSRFRGSGH